MLSTAGCVLSFLLLTTVSAAPYEKRWGGSWGGSWGSGGGWGDRGDHWWQPSKTSSYLDFGKRWGEQHYTPTCDIKRAVSYMNLGLASSPSPLPSPDSSMELFQVVIGRGTQNYTCDLANATATPAPVGAVASLFNVSCIAADMPELLEKLPGIALDLPVPSTDDERSALVKDMSGHHYFVNDTTPYFNMDTSINNYGKGALKKAAVADAPANAIVGPRGKGDGAVAWLMLSANDYPAWGQPDWKAVYRLNTAGGNPPKMCTGQPESFTVEYASEYWLFK